MRKSLNLLWTLISLICTDLCRLLCPIIKVQHLIQSWDTRTTLVAGSWSTHHPGGCSRSQVAGGGAEVQMCSRSQPVAESCGLYGQSPWQDTPLAKPLVLPGLSFLIFKMEGAEFIEAVVKGCLESPRHLSQGRGCVSKDMEHQNRPGQEALWAEGNFQ